MAKNEFTSWMTKVFGANLLALIGNLLIGVLSARLLTVQGKGLYNIVMLWSTMGSVAALVGLPSATIYLYAKANRSEDRFRIVGTALMMTLVWSLSVCAALHVLLPQLLGHLGRETVTWSEIALIQIPLSNLTAIGMALLSVENEFKQYSIIRIVQVALTALASVLLAFTHSLTAISLIEVNILGSIALCIVVATITFKVMKRKSMSIWLPTLAVVFSMTKYGVKFYAVTMTTLFNSKLDQMLSTVWLSSTQVAFYVVASSSLNIATTATGSFATVFFPTAAKGDSTDVIEKTELSARRGLVVLVMFSICVILLSRPVLGILYGMRYLPAWPIVLMLSPIIVVGGVTQVIYQGCYARGVVRIPAIGEGVGALSGAILLWCFVPKWGVYGAAIATTISYVLGWAVVLLMWSFQRSLKASLFPTMTDVRYVLNRLGTLLQLGKLSSLVRGSD